MEKELTIYRESNWTQVLKEEKRDWKKLLLKPIDLLRRYYASVLEREISLRQTAHLLHAQAAFLAVAFGEGVSLGVRTLFALWFLLAVLQCKKHF